MLRHTPGDPPTVAILPTAAGLEDVTSWITMGVAQFRGLGCDAYGVRALDREGVENPEHVAALARANLIYLSGGSPGYLVDTLRASHLRSYGYVRPTSPFLDALAAQGLRFARHLSQSSWTKCSMASLWTGLYPQHSGVTRFDDVIARDAVTAAEVFKSAGFV